jgi:polyisoprenoid-binding protein YceI
MLYNVSAYSQSTSNVKVFADKKKSSVTYSMNHPLHQWDAVCKGVSSVIIFNKSNQSISSVAVLLKVASFDSQNANRDSHTIEVLEGIKYPLVTFTSTSVSIEDDQLNVSGDLTFHGVTKAISIHAVTKKEGADLIVTGSFEVKMTDYKVTPPSLMGLTTDDNIKINFLVDYMVQ